MLGLLLTYFCSGSLLLQCGDVESNPGPKFFQKFWRTGAGTNSTSGERPANSQDDASNQPEKEPSLSDVMSKLVSMDAKFDSMNNEVHELREDNAALKAELKGLHEEVGNLSQKNHDLLQKTEELTKKLEELPARILLGKDDPSTII
ncbi:hypothetical protein ACOMHN_036884 [Nucella lapillus]